MGTAISQKTVDVTFTDQDGKLKGRVDDTLDQEHARNDKVLRLHYSLMGELSPVLSPLSVSYSFGDETVAYRYDWVVGFTPRRPCYEWKWWNQIGPERAIVAQLLIDPGESGCGVSEMAAVLLALSPSKDTSSWLDRNAENLGRGLAKLSEAELFGNTGSSIMKASAVMSNLVASETKGRKDWFLYRFVDEGRKCGAVEWNISRNTVHAYGPLLRGSILLAFHGDEKPRKPMTMLLRPRVSFEKDSLDLQPPFEQLEDKNPVQLMISPVAAQPRK